MWQVRLLSPGCLRVAPHFARAAAVKGVLVEAEVLACFREQHHN